MSTEKDGWNAFPSPLLAVPHERGMSLRDYFAAQVIPIVIQETRWADAAAQLDDMARHAYAIADAMLKAREAK